MEDAVAIHKDVGGYKCAAVFDGHGGDKAAKLAQELLPQQLHHHLELATDKEKAILDAFEASEQRMHEELADEANSSPSGTSSGTVVCDGAKVSSKTVDHSPEKNVAEKNRLQNLGVNIDGGYVDGKVQVGLCNIPAPVCLVLACPCWVLFGFL